MDDHKHNESESEIESATNRLYGAVSDYVQAMGGSALVIGGIKVIQFENDLEHNWLLGIQCMGRPPSVAQPTDKEMES